jgi:hypothetical protein
METKAPALIGRRYTVISGPYKGFLGKCVSTEDDSALPVILQDGKYNVRAVKIEEI